MKEPRGLVSVDEILGYVQSDCYLDLAALAAYSSISTRTLKKILPPRLLFKVGAKKNLVRRSEFDEWLESFRASHTDLDHIAEMAVEEVLGKD